MKGPRTFKDIREYYVALLTHVAELVFELCCLSLSVLDPNCLADKIFSYDAWVWDRLRHQRI